MAELGEATIKIKPDTSEVSRSLRVIAKHFTACADELDGKQQGPAIDYRGAATYTTPEEYTQILRNNRGAI